MDLLDRLLGHDSWTTLELLKLSRPLTEEQLDRDFDVGHGTLRATFEHIVFNVEAWTDCMAGRPIRSRGGQSIAELEARMQTAALDLRAVSCPIADRNAWDETWVDPSDDVTRTYGGAIAHIITHSMHHRAQVLYLLRKLGVDKRPEGDVLSWEKQFHLRTAAPGDGQPI